MGITQPKPCIVTYAIIIQPNTLYEIIMIQPKPCIMIETNQFNLKPCIIDSLWSKPLWFYPNLGLLSKLLWFN